MKKLILSLFVMLLSLQVNAQFGGYDPVSMEETFVVKGSEGTIEFDALIDNGYHLYSTDVPEDGPTATSVEFHVVEGAEIVGPLVAGEGFVKELDEDFGMVVSYFENEALFIQKVKLLGGAYRIEGSVRYQSCGKGQCYMGRYDFELTGTANVEVKAKEEKKTEKKPETAQKAEEKKSTAAPAQKEVKAVALVPAVEKTAKNNVPVSDPLQAEEKSVAGVQDNVPASDNADAKTEEKATEDSKSGDAEKESASAEGEEGETSLWMLFVLGFGGGLIALLTPCVWPIIPMTVSFFLKRSKERSKAVREAVLYGVSIVVIYLVLGLLVTFIFGAGALNALATNAVFNIFFFLMLVVFGASFLGGFELTLPSSWTNKVDEKASSTTGVLSIFLMAFTLVLVSFSCTGPIIGFLLVSVADSGEILAPAVGMLGFALALALPFTVFAVFPSLIKQAPRSGGWMNTIKVVLGFVELAFALKFLSVADLAYGWGILDRETFLALWIVLFALLGLYLLKIIRFPHDDPEDKTTSVPGFFMGLISLAFAMYMVPGLWGAPCKAISAFAPPMSTQDFVLSAGSGNGGNSESGEAIHVNDYDKALELSREKGMPVLLDFTGHGCVNCRNMEAAVWSDNRVKDVLKHYIVASLYVDDRTGLEKPYEVTVDDGKGGKKNVKIRTVGEKWTYLQNSMFGANAQPFYIIVDGDGNSISPSYGYDQDIDKCIKFLEDGLKEFKKK